eukprot:GEMP01079043.1.p1 GENE.GEMP01079043.1~~GEMP01079043.1.p1  ORF type:complete len:112 (+),score=0.17 GEMP01079043.1:388-723(+)
MYFLVVTFKMCAPSEIQLLAVCILSFFFVFSYRKYLPMVAHILTSLTVSTHALFFFVFRYIVFFVALSRGFRQVYFFEFFGKIIIERIIKSSFNTQEIKNNASVCDTRRHI